MLRDEIRHLLQELAGAVGAVGAGVVHDVDADLDRPDRPDMIDRTDVSRASVRPDVRPDDGQTEDDAEGITRMLVCFPLGRSTSLQLAIAMPAPARPPTKVDEVLGMDQRMNVERTVRAVRAAVRRWQAERAPVMTVTAAEPPPPPRERVRERIQTFLHALANIHGAANVLVTLRGEVVTASVPPDALQRERLPFILRRVAAEAARQPGRSHAELVGEEFYAASFWFDACLLAFFSGPYAVDFFRHRARMVIREIAQLLPLFDEPPPAPAQQAPLPE